MMSLTSSQFSSSETFQTWYLYASQRFDLDVLREHLEEIKGKAFSKREFEFLVAALCEISIEDLAEALGHRKLKGITVDISKSIGSYIKELLKMNSNRRLHWKNICKLLADGGYSKCTLKEAEDQLERISTVPNPRALFMIQTLNKKIFDIKNSSHFVASSDIVDSIITNGDSKSEQGNYADALTFYFLAAQANPFHSAAIAKIVLCLKRLKAYKDATDMALYSLDLISPKQENVRGSIYQVLAGSLRQLALQQLNNNLLRQVIHYYTEAVRLSPNNCLNSWNAFELLVEFDRRNQNSCIDYLIEAKLWYLIFESAAMNPLSNFQDDVYRANIRRDRDRILTWLDDVWLKNKLFNL